ncbi:MAG: TIGR03620 family F420-dependent LLM class oxidoreductase [Acidimicrobiia bacterium]|nr:TIGR03620 family F420-dependent LLM class oxidoreductase [Acidimicrobiia bacterium]
MDPAPPDVGRYGIWTFQLDQVPSAEAAASVGELEDLGFGCVWVPEAVGREAFTSASLLLRGGHEIVVATGVAQIWARAPSSAAAAHKTLTEAYPDRFVLGLGVSHQPMVEGLLGMDYSRPYSAMVDYLDAMDGAVFVAAPPTAEPRRVLAALGPRMLALAGERAAGALTYFVPPAHTASARAALGADALLAVEQAVVLETDPDRAREVARTHTRIYTGLPNYANNLRRVDPTLTDADFADGGSDRLVDLVVAWGDVDTVCARIAAHHDAGADHVCIQVIDGTAAVPQTAWHDLAAALDL